MTRALFRLWALFLLLKLLVSAWLPMTPDEAYYWVWSRHLQLSYFDHPAMVAWLMALGEPFLGLARAVRWPSVILGHITVLIWLELLGDLIDERGRKLFLLLATFSPLIGLGSLIVTPDVPLVFFWSLALWCLQKALSSHQLRWYGFLGLALGLGFCSKYPIVLFVPILLLWLTLDRRWRQVSWRGVGLCIASGLLASLPVLYWNWQHDFVSFRFQLNHGLGQTQWSPRWTGEYLLGQMLLLFPAIVYLLCQRTAFKPRHWLWLFGWGPIAFFLATSLKSPVEANWPIVAYPSLIALAVYAAHSLRAGETLLRMTVAIWAAAGLMLIANIVYPWLPLQSLSARYEIMSEYRELAKIVSSHQPLYAGNYQIASQLSFETQIPVSKLRGYSRKDFFDEIEDSLPHGDPFFIIIEKEQRFPEYLKTMGYETFKRTRLDHHHFLIEVRRQ